MARGPLNKYEHPELPNALSWLRNRLKMTQREVAEAAGISQVYYSQIERGALSAEGLTKFPSVPTLDLVLGAVNSDFDELEGLLVHKPWTETPQTQARSNRASSGTPRPDGYSEVKAHLTAASISPQSPITRIPPPANLSHSAGDRIRGKASELNEIFLNGFSGLEQDNLLVVARKWDRRRRDSDQ
jgi:transcriptional regulator with XRE-family HTH domain